MSTATLALPHVMDPMYWIGPGGLFASAVLPGILLIVFIGMLFPFLPGDSLLFAGGLLAAGGTLNIWTLVILIPIIAITGDQIAYSIGRGIGPALFKKEDSRIFKKSNGLLSAASPSLAAATFWPSASTSGRSLTLPGLYTP